MSKTINQLAAELGIDRQRVYRFIKKNELIEEYQKMNVKFYDEKVEKLIKSTLQQRKSMPNTNRNYENDKFKEEFIEFLKKQIEEKDKQIAEFLKQQDQQQQLFLLEKTKALPSPKEKRKWSWNIK